MLAVGSLVPNFTLPDQFGAEHSLYEELVDGPVLLVFFPLAFSPVCTGELQMLEARRPGLAAARVTLLGVTVDSKFSLQAWARAEGVGFELLADFWPHGAVSEAFGVFLPERGFAGRASFLIGADRRILTTTSSEPGVARSEAEYDRMLATLQ